MDLYWETTDTNDITNADKGAKWHIERKNNIITFWIDIPPLGLYSLSKTSWKAEDAALVLNTMDNGFKVYIVADLQFRHLQIMEYEKGKWLVHLCSYLSQ